MSENRCDRCNGKIGKNSGLCDKCLSQAEVQRAGCIKTILKVFSLKKINKIVNGGSYSG